MRYITTVLLLSIFVLMLSGCGSTTQIPDDCAIPEWYKTLPSDPQHFYAATTSTSKDMQLSVDKATADARVEIGRQLEAKIKGLQKRFIEQSGTASNGEIIEQFSQAYKIVVSNILTGSHSKNQDVCVEDKKNQIYRSYVLMEYPIGDANNALVQEIKKNERLRTDQRVQEMMKDLEEEVKNFEDSKN